MTRLKPETLIKCLVNKKIDEREIGIGRFVYF